MKILICGIVASGKTTLAKKLSEELSIPFYEGDCIAWGFPHEARYKRSYEEQKEIINNINKNDDWIVEGTYRENQKVLYDIADKIIFLDTPLYVRRYRIITRFLKQKFGYEKCNYDPTYNMLKHMFVWTNDFERNRSTYINRLMNYEDKLIWIKSVKNLKRKQKI